MAELLEKINNELMVHTKGLTIGNVGFLLTDAGSYLIDTGMYPVVAKGLRVESEFMGTKGLAGVIITHYHGDHVWGTGMFKDKPIYAHSEVVENMQRALQTNWAPEAIQDRINQMPDEKHLFDGLDITLPTSVFSDDVYHIGDITLYHTGGHTSGSTLVYYNNILFVGDLIFEGQFPWGGDQTADPYKWLSALDKMIELSPGIIVPGHGNVQYDLREVQEYHRFFSDIITHGERLAAEDATEEQALQELRQLSFHEARTEQMKDMSLKHWYRVIKENSMRK